MKRRFIRTVAVVTVEELGDGRYLVRDGDKKFEIDKESLERDYEELL